MCNTVENRFLNLINENGGIKLKCTQISKFDSIFYISYEKHFMSLLIGVFVSHANSKINIQICGIES